ncbi:unnamed protein product, partial [Amoebophrya sp. A25]
EDVGDLDGTTLHSPRRASASTSPPSSPRRASSAAINYGARAFSSENTTSGRGSIASTAKANIGNMRPSAAAAAPAGDIRVEQPVGVLDGSDAPTARASTDVVGRAVVRDEDPQ